MANMNQQIRVVFDRRKKATRSNPGTIEIEVVTGRDRKRISTGIKVLPNQWKDGKVVNHDKEKEYNRTIEDMYNDIFLRLSSMAKTGVVDFDIIKGSKVRAVESSNDFLKWLEGRIELRQVAESTKKQHKVMLKCLKEFHIIRTFDDVSTKNIKMWDDFIRTKVTAQTSVHGYHKRLKPYITEAIQMGLLDSNPYGKIKIERGKSEGIKFLTEEERDTIEALNCFGPVEKARDMFIFSCYTGLAYTDLVKIRRDDIQKNGDDYCIRDKRQKTKVPYTIVLLPKAMEILQKYNYCLELMTNQKCNEYLKIIAQMARINLNLTMHVGRHTFATWALSKGVGIETVSKMLAHTNVAMTEKYAQVLQSSVFKGYDVLKTASGQ